MSIRTPTDAFTMAHRFQDYLSTAEALGTRSQFLHNYVGGTDKDPLRMDEAMLFLQHEQMTFARGLPIFVREDTMDLVNEAVEELKSEVLLRQDLPCDFFTLWFEKPMVYDGVYYDDDGNQLSEPWIVHGMGVSFTDRIGVNPSTKQELVAGSVEPQISVDGCALYLYGEPQGRSVLTPEVRKQFGPYFMIDMVGVAFDSDWSTLSMVENDPVRNIHKFLIALCRLMGQHIELQPDVPPRPVRRAVERKGWKVPEQGYLSIIRLIPSIYGEEGESDEDRRLRFRHRVRGHWQQFYCSSRGLPVGDPGAYRLRYVNAYVRGPKDSPLVESSKVGVV